VTVRTRRVYDEPTDDDGYRVLVDRLWPRGLTKERARVDLWLKEVAPSTGLRKAFHHEDLPFDEFARRYRAELADNQAAVEELREIVAGHDVVTLLYGASDPWTNHTVVLTALLA
jgi:DNA-3-methyladenine glycosylase